MQKSKVVPLNFGAAGRKLALPFSCDVQRSKRKTLALHVAHKQVLVKAPWQASRAELAEFVEDNRDWIEKRLYEESLRYRESLRIERGGKIFFRARERTIEFKEGRKQRVLVNGSRFIIQGHKLDFCICAQGLRAITLATARAGSVSSPSKLCNICQSPNVSFSSPGLRRKSALLGRPNLRWATVKVSYTIRPPGLTAWRSAGSSGRCR